MKSIKEKELLVNLSKAFGQDVDPALLEEVNAFKTIKESVQKSVKRNALTDLAKALVDDSTKPKVEPIAYPLPPSLDEMLSILNETVIEEKADELVQTQTIEEVRYEETLPDTAEPVAEPTLAERTAKFISEAPKDSFQQPDPLVVPDNMDAIRGKLKFLEQWISKVSTTGPGSGEVNFRKLDDVDRWSVGNTELVLRYNPATKKFFFGTLVGDQGPIRSMTYDTRGYSSNITPGVGTTAWNAEKDCLEIFQGDGTTLQTGLEQYIRVYNSSNTETLSNGTFVSLDTVFDISGEIPSCAKYQANAGSFPYFNLGLLTNDIPPKGVGRATIFGEVHDLDTTGNSVNEVWVNGEILWADPTTAGKLTKYRPTAPNVVVAVGKVLTVDSLDGIILVRPQVLPNFYYGTFISTQDQRAANINYPHAIRYDYSAPTGIVISQSGFHLEGNSKIVSEVQGLFNYQFSLQLTSGNSSKKNIYIWPRINGQDVENSATKLTVEGTGESVAAWNIVFSMVPGRYFELMYAVDDISLYLDNPPATSFCPAIPSVIMTVTQVNS